MNDSKAPAVARTSHVGFGMVDKAVIRDRTLPVIVKTVYTYLTTYCGDTRTAFPSRATIAKDTGISVRSVDSAVKIAEAVRLFTVKREKIGKLNRSNQYLLHDFGGYVPGSGPVAPKDEKASGGGAGAAPPSAAPAPGSAGAAPEEDHVSRPEKETTSSPTARPRSAERGRTRPAKAEDPRVTRRADYPATDDWITDDLEELVVNIEAHVGELYGMPDGLDNLLQSKITPSLDLETFEELPFIPPTARHLMNIALKAGRWGTVDFRWIRLQEGAGESVEHSTPVVAERGINASFVNDPWGDA